MHNSALDDHMLEAFMPKFYGYGSYKADWWFVGMEEGCDPSGKDIHLRLNAWSKHGEPELADLVDFHEAIGVTKHFNRRAALQRTWASLIRIKLAGEGKSPTTEMVRDCQRSSWLRTSGNSCGLELLPLPSPSTKVWHYKERSKLPGLSDRAAYATDWMPRRAAHIAQRVADYQPRTVVFYGMTYLDSWQAISEARLERTSDPQIRFAERRGTTYLAIPHPTYTGLTSEFFHSVGRIAADRSAR